MNGSSAIVAGVLGVSGANGSDVPGTMALMTYPRGLATGPTSTSDVVVADSYVFNRDYCVRYVVSLYTVLGFCVQNFTHYPHSVRKRDYKHACGGSRCFWFSERTSDCIKIQPAFHGIAG